MRYDEGLKNSWGFCFRKLGGLNLKHKPHKIRPSLKLRPTKFNGRKAPNLSVVPLNTGFKVRPPDDSKSYLLNPVVINFHFFQATN